MTMQGNEIAALGNVDLFSVPDAVAGADTDDSWEAAVASLSADELATRRDEDIADALVDARRPPIALNLGPPRYEGSVSEPVTGAIIATYSVPFQGALTVLIGPGAAPDASAHPLRATIEGQRILFAYRVPEGTPGRAARIAEHFERSHQRLEAGVARRTKRVDDGRAVARGRLMRLLRERRARDQGDWSLDQELQTRLNDYVRR